jgi:hypothetical protein
MSKKHVNYEEDKNKVPMNKPYNIQNTNICNGIFHISFFKGGRKGNGAKQPGANRNRGETTHGANRIPGKTSWIHQNSQLWKN